MSVFQQSLKKSLTIPGLPRKKLRKQDGKIRRIAGAIHRRFATPLLSFFCLTSYPGCVTRRAVDKDTKKTAIQMAYASSIGIAMVLAIFGCFFLGIWMDGKLGTGPYLTLLFLLIGIVAGFRNLYLLTQRYLKDEQTLITGVKSEPHRKRPPPKKA